MVGFVSRLCLVLCGVLLAGCGGADYQGAKRYSLSGKVMFGGEPVERGFISFIPQAPGEDSRPSGGAISGGEYVISEEKGANAGTYRVEIRWSRPTGKKSFNPAREEMVDEVQEVIPPRFNTQSELTVQVSATETKFDFDLDAN